MIPQWAVNSQRERADQEASAAGHTLLKAYSSYSQLTTSILLCVFLLKSCLIMRLPVRYPVCKIATLESFLQMSGVLSKTREKGALLFYIPKQTNKKNPKTNNSGACVILETFELFIFQFNLISLCIRQKVSITTSSKF